MISTIGAACAVVATGAVVLLLRHETRGGWGPFLAPLPILATAALGGAPSAAAFAVALVLARFHPWVSPLVPLALAYWVGPSALAATGAWLLLAARPWWLGLGALAAASAFSPLAGPLGLAGAMVGYALRAQPSAADVSRMLARLAPWTLALPSLALFGVAVLGRASTGDWRILQWAAFAAAFGVWLTFAVAGLGLRVVAMDGRAAAWAAAAAAGTFLVLGNAAGRTLDAAQQASGPLWVAFAILAGPFASRVHPAWSVPLFLVPLLAVLSQL